jgi:DNA repair exonuclease SbcCD nuclease subunit
MTNKLRIASFSDIHLGASRTTTPEILAGLYDAFDKNRLFENIDVLIIAGDLFDRLLEVNNEHLTSIIVWMSYVIRQCERKDITLLVLAGTKSHDRDQNELWVSTARAMRSSCKLHYANTLSIEYFKDWDMNVLFVPDNLNPDSSVTWAELEELMEAKGLKKVDFAVMHGQFQHQLPEFISEKSPATHKNSNYLNIVEHYIFVGHIHTHSVYDRILAQGSFDRMAHGEEEPKGFLMAEINLRGNVSDDWFTFIPNPRAKKYITINCMGLELDQALVKIAQEIEILSDGEYARIEAEKTSPIFSNMEEVMKMAPLVKWSTLKRDLEQEAQEKVIDAQPELQEWKPIRVDKTNIVEVVQAELASLMIDPVTSNYVMEVIQRIK